MKETLGISIEGERAKMVLGKRKGGEVIIDEVFDIDISEIKDYLQRLKVRKTYLHYEDRELIEEVFSLPPAKERDIKTLIGTELKRTSPKEGDYLFWYVPYAPEDEPKEYLTIASRRTNVETLIQILLEAGKRPEIVLPNYLPLLFLVPYSERPVLLYYPKGSQRTIILVKEQKPLMVRTVGGDPYLFTTSDLQHLNMTYNYCRGMLNLEVEMIYIIGPQDFSPDINISLPVPIASLYLKGFRLPKSITLETFKEFILPAAIFLRPPKARDMLKAYLPLSYRVFRTMHQFLTIMVLIFIIAGLLLGVSLTKKAMDIKRMAFEIDSLHRQTRVSQLYDMYSRLKARREALMPVKKYLILYQKTPLLWDIIARVIKAIPPDVTLNSIIINYNQKGIMVQFEGRSPENTQIGLLRQIDTIRKGLKLQFKNSTVQSSYSFKDWTFQFTVDIRET